LTDRGRRPLAGALATYAVYVSLVVGELAPKAIALRNPERLACLVGPLVDWISRASPALVRILTASTNGLLRP
jgi:putative hemolysin